MSCDRLWEAHFHDYLEYYCWYFQRIECLFESTNQSSESNSLHLTDVKAKRFKWIFNFSRWLEWKLIFLKWARSEREETNQYIISLQLDCFSIFVTRVSTLEFRNNAHNRSECFLIDQIRHAFLSLRDRTGKVH